MFVGKVSFTSGKWSAKPKLGNPKYNNNINFVQQRTITVRPEEYIGKDTFRPNDSFDFKSWYIKKDIQNQAIKEGKLPPEEKEPILYDFKTLLEKMHKAYPNPNEGLYNKIIQSLVKSGSCRGALYTIHDMKAHGLIPSADSYSTVIMGLYKNNLDFEGGNYICKEMLSYYPNVRLPSPFSEELPHPLEVSEYFELKTTHPTGVAEKLFLQKYPHLEGQVLNVAEEIDEEEAENNNKDNNN